MEPKHDKERLAFRGGPMVSKASINDDPNDFNVFDEDGNLHFLNDKAPDPDDIDAAEEKAKEMSDEEIKIKALNLAINIAKLMNDVTTEDVLKIAAKVAVFIKEEKA
jgi:hypothetical protein